MPSASARLGALFALLLSSAAQAAPDAPSIDVRLELKSNADCVSRAALIARVRSRSPRIRFVDDASEPTIRATFTALPTGNVTSEIALAAPYTEVPERRFAPSSCNDALDAVALIIAISLDPAAATASPGQQTPAIPSKETPPDADSAPVAPSSANVATPDAPAQKSHAFPVSREGRAPLSTTPQKNADQSGAPRPRLGVAVEAQTMFGPAPSVMPGVSVYATVALDHSALWSPALMLGALHAWQSDVAEQGGRASFRLDAVSLDACALRAELDVLEARACGSALFGRLSTRGSDTINPGASARPFATAGAALLVTLRLSAWLELSARGGAGATLMRDSYEFTPMVFHTAAPVTFAASLGLGLRMAD
ncbi:MAG TPA: hypothetical protein VGI10_15775 [Polyangiaceae bacterium]|jgi:hypothetical protein